MRTVAPDLPGRPGPEDRDREDRERDDLEQWEREQGEPVPGEVLDSHRLDEPLLGGAPRRLMVRLLVLAVGAGLLVPTLLWLVADGPAWALVRVGSGVAAVVFTVGWRILRVLHRAGRLP
jgi:hypothetical protein